MWRVQSRQAEREDLAPKMVRTLEGAVEGSPTPLRGPGPVQRSPRVQHGPLASLLLLRPPPAGRGGSPAERRGGSQAPPAAAAAAAGGFLPKYGAGIPPAPPPPPARGETRACNPARGGRGDLSLWGLATGAKAGEGIPRCRLRSSPCPWYPASVSPVSG